MSVEIRRSVKQVIEPQKNSVIDWNELWEYRQLFFFLAWRDIKIRYKQTILGGLWAIIQPLSAMVVFSLFFGKLAKMPSDGVPYPVFSFAALVPWQFFANSVSQSSQSLVSNAAIITKIYFPRIVIPCAAVLSGIVDFLIAFAVLLGIMFYFGIVPTLNVIFLPAFFLLALLTSLGTGLWLSALNVKFRDIRYTITFMIQLWLFITPIVYPSSLLPEFWRTVYAVNPMASVVEGFRWSLLGTETAPGAMFIVSAIVAIIIFITGLFHFQKVEGQFSDII